jgi:hypothetical protein
VLLFVLALALPDALLNRPYQAEAAWERAGARCSMPIPVTRVMAGALPAGMRVSGRGELLGIPTELGFFQFTVEISDGCSRRLDQRQIRVVPAPILTAEAEIQEFHCPQGALPFSAGNIRVSGSAPGRAYTVDIVDGAWLQAAMRDGVLPAEGSSLEADVLRLSINPSKLAPGNYSARLRLSTWQGANTPELHFQLRVDSAQAIFAPLTPALLPAQIVYQIIEAPNARSIVPTQVALPEPPRFPLYQPKPTPPRPGGMGSRAPGRSRILPFPKIILPPKAPTKTEAPPERTKPSAMPPPAAGAVKGDKPKAAH